MLEILLISFVFTWVFGLFFPIILRFVIFRRPLSKVFSFFVTFIIFFVQTIISVSLNDRPRSHGALLLVAFVSYWILRKEKSKDTTSTEQEEVNNDQSQTKQCEECGNKIHIAATICNRCNKKTI